ncbi:MAG TPA: hypothetical protein VMZ28_06360 [Kofleriaceae bacterium]|nr:hypothetical protein [Kofleriaceae bacterium]
MKPAPLAILLSLTLASACSPKDPAKDKEKEQAAAQEKETATAKAKARTPPPESILGELIVDGTPFQVTSCTPGTKHQFLGFDLKSWDKRRLWISAAPPGRARVHVFRTPVLPVELGRCADAQVNEIEPPVGGVVGSFTADCAAVGHTVTGSMTVTDCR